jgi:hypothetical protein
MLLFRRPLPSARFTSGRLFQSLERERARIRADIAANRKPVIDKELWGRFKTEFAAAQLNRCGYCELNVIAGHRGDVEHYAPKNDLRQFTGVPNEEGVEIDNSATVKGRIPALVSDVGYWWLAYDWSNYLLSCVVCNQVWKANLFPVRDAGTRALPPSQEALERSLLLNPFGTIDPTKHLQFNEDGSVAPRRASPYGKETIRTVGLNRAALREERRNTTELAFRNVFEANAAHQRGVAAKDNASLRDLHRMGEAGRPFAGAVRTIIRQQLSGFDEAGGAVTWDDLDKLFGG